MVFSWQSRGCWEGKAEPASFLVKLEVWRTGAVVLWETGGPSPLPTATSDSQEWESCQVTCRGQYEPEAPASALNWEAGRVLSVWDWWTAGGHLMAWVWVCTSCCRQLAETVLPTPTWVGAEERTPLLGPAPASQSPRPSILKGLGTPNAGFSCPPDNFASSDPLSGECRKVDLSAGISTWGPAATRASRPTAVLLADLEQDARQGECALPVAAPAGLAPVKPEASQSSGPGPTSCMGASIEAGRRDTGSAGPELESCLPCCDGGQETPEPRRGQLLTRPGGLWGR